MQLHLMDKVVDESTGIASELAITKLGGGDVVLNGRGRDVSTNRLGVVGHKFCTNCLGIGSLSMLAHNGFATGCLNLVSQDSIEPLLFDFKCLKESWVSGFRAHVDEVFQILCSALVLKVSMP